MVLTLPCLLLLSLLGTGCRTGCEARSAGPERDRCVHDRLLGRPGAEVDLVVADAGAIQDPVMRQAAVYQWVMDHGRELGQGRAMALCNTLEEPGRGTCLRRLSSAHLQR